MSFSKQNLLEHHSVEALFAAESLEMHFLSACLLQLVLMPELLLIVRLLGPLLIGQPPNLNVPPGILPEVSQVHHKVKQFVNNIRIMYLTEAFSQAFKA
jgi:hypothetical protein